VTVTCLVGGWRGCMAGNATIECRSCQLTMAHMHASDTHSCARRAVHGGRRDHGLGAAGRQPVRDAQPPRHRGAHLVTVIIFVHWGTGARRSACMRCNCCQNRTSACVPMAGPRCCAPLFHWVAAAAGGVPGTRPEELPGCGRGAQGAPREQTCVPGRAVGALWRARVAVAWSCRL
jgi:hypothetical protein